LKPQTCVDVTVDDIVEETVDEMEVVIDGVVVSDVLVVFGIFEK
jgi:hypothetical protein